MDGSEADAAAASLVLPRVSVLMPVYNAAPFLGEALRSILSQTLRELELIAIDDGSTDGSLQILKEFAAEDGRVKVSTRENRGVIATRNELLTRARGELVAWMDSDDISVPERLQKQAERFARYPQLVCLGSGATLVDLEGNPLGVETYPETHDAIQHEQRTGGGVRFGTTMMRRHAALTVGGFREPFRIGEDFDFLLRLGSLGELGNLREPLYLYRQHLTSTCASYAQVWEAYRDRILELAEERRSRGRDRLQEGRTIDVPVPAPAVSTGKSRGATYVQWSRSAFHIGNRPLAWRYAYAAIASAPVAPFPWRNLCRLALSSIRG